MKKASGKRRKNTNKRKQHNPQPVSLPPTSNSSQLYGGLPQTNSLPPTSNSSQPYAGLPQLNSLPPTSNSSQPYIGLSQANALPPTFPPQRPPLPSFVPPQRPSLPPNIPPPSTSLAPGFPPLSTSLPPSFFSIPPYGTNTSQNGISSSLLPSLTPVVSPSPTSSTPSISKSNIGVSVPASSSISSTTAPTCSKSKNIGETREYDVYHRLIITPDEDGFAPSYAGSHMVSESILPFFNDAWGRWKDFPYNIREQIWNQFRTKCAWQPCYENKINSIFEKKARVRVSDMLFDVRKSNENPDWLQEEVWVKFLEKWNTPEFKKKCERAKAARASIKGGSLHTGGSMSFAAHRRKMTKIKGEEVSVVEVFEETHKKRNEDGTRGEWIESRAEETFVGFHRSLDEWRQTQPTSEASSTIQPSSDDITSIWTNVAGGVKKGRVYGLGVQPSSCHPSPLLSRPSASQSSKEMEAMKRQISELTQRLQTSEANFAKVQKFMEKHMAESDDGEEETDSNEE